MHNIDIVLCPSSSQILASPLCGGVCVQGASPLALIARLCCSIDQPSQAPTTKTITNTPRSSTFSHQQPAVTSSTSSHREINFRSGGHAHSSPIGHRRGRRRPDPLSTRRSVDTAKRQLPLPPPSALDFYFRSLLATRSLAAVGPDFRYRTSAVGRRRVLPMFSGIARPRPFRPVPRLPCLLTTAAGTAVGQEVCVSSMQLPPAFSQFRSQLISSDSFPPHLRWFTSGIECETASRDYLADNMAPAVTSSALDSGTYRHYHQRPATALHWSPSSSLCLRPLPWQPSH